MTALLIFVCGFLIGFASAIVFVNMSCKKEKEEKDPADWWKRGENPYDYTEI